MNDQELTTAVRESVDGARMSVPEEQIVSRGRAIRAARRRRVAAGVTAVATAGAAAIAAALVLPGPAVPATQDTAYLVSHVTQALDSVPASTILLVHATTGQHSDVTDTWGRGQTARGEVFTPAGQLASDWGFAATSTTLTSVYVNYRDRTWSRWAGPLGMVPAIAATDPIPPSVLARTDPTASFAMTDNASRTAAYLRALVSDGMLKADGTATVGGVTAIKLTTLVYGITHTWYVSPATYLPIRMTITRPGTLFEQDDIQWLPPTPANLAKLSFPAAPPGFTQVRPIP